MIHDYFVGHESKHILMISPNQITDKPIKLLEENTVYKPELYI